MSLPDTIAAPRDETLEALPGPGGESEAPPAPAPASLWRNRGFVLLWSGQTVSTVGSTASSIVFPLLILAITNSPAAAGLAGALFSLPYLFFSLPPRALVDRLDPKRVMILCDAGAGIRLA